MKTRIVVILLFVPWLAASGQVSRRSVTTVAPPPPGVVIAAIPTPVATAPLRGLIEFSLPAGSKVSLRPYASPLQSPTAPFSVFQREIRSGQQVLVETAYAVVTQPGIPTGYQAMSERVYPGDSKLVYTGPWSLMNLRGGGGGWGGDQVYYAYLLRPLDRPVLTARAPARTRTVAELTAGTLPAPRSSAPAQTVTAAALESLAPVAEGCGVEIASQAIGAPGEVLQLVCLRLADGQSVTLADGARLFRRGASIEIWKGDELLESANGLVVRDERGRHWLLEPEGYL